MHESTPDNKWIGEGEQNEDVATGNDPNEILKAQLVMLMRLYDIQMAILTKTDPKQADNIFDAHDRGELFNPQLFIPGE